MKINKITELAGIQLYFVVYDTTSVSPKDLKTNLKIMDTDEIYIEYKTRHELESIIIQKYQEFIAEANLVGPVRVVLKLSDGSFMPDYESYELRTELTEQTISQIIDRHFDLVDAPI